jgi:hypothetical protein
LLSFLGYGEPLASEPLATWQEPSVRLTAYQFTPVGPTRFRAELYFLLDQHSSSDLAVELRFDAIKQDSLADKPQTMATLRINASAQGGEGDRMGIAHRVLAGVRPLGEFQLSLRHADADAPHLLTDDDKSFVRLPVAM